MKWILLAVRVAMALFQRVFNFLTAGQLPPFVSVAVIIRKADRILMIDRRDGRGLGLPGGYLKLHEKVEDAVRREVKEETGLDFEIDAFVGTLSGRRRKCWVRTVDLVFEGRVSGGELATSIEGQCQWVIMDEIRDQVAFDYLDILDNTAGEGATRSIGAVLC